MTLRQEIGAVMMVGFKGSLTPAILADWRQHQFGGLIVVPINQNGQDPAAIRQLIQSVRGVMAHPVLTATNQEGGTVCFQETRVPCLAGASQVGAQGPAAVQSEMTSMSQGLKALGFDINFAPVADIWDGVDPVMSERTYGQNPQTVAQDVTAAIAGIHAAGIYAVAKRLSVQTPQTRGWIPFQAAIASHVEFVMMASSSQLHTLRTELGYQGVIISGDLQMGALSPGFPPASAAVLFLVSGGDMVIVSHDIAVADATYDAIRAAVLSGTYPRAQLDASVQKLLSLGLRYMP
jgi:beta-N-acetylhexosaminidase